MISLSEWEQLLVELDVCPVWLCRMLPAVLLTTHGRSVSDCTFVPFGTPLHLISPLFRSLSAAWSEDLAPRGFTQMLLQQELEERHLQTQTREAWGHSVSQTGL